ncbi:hypothetical protein GGR42_000673 [Saonia flava]|uniref:Uncharacterized protein n=1 Tax=Saonia flava TaxID=523696 RepID=A0A846QQ42_9FLAO|nr:hypothetical protein [Saonia flava]
MFGYPGINYTGLVLLLGYLITNFNVDFKQMKENSKRMKVVF